MLSTLANPGQFDALQDRNSLLNPSIENPRDVFWLMPWHRGFFFRLGGCRMNDSVETLQKLVL